MVETGAKLLRNENKNTNQNPPGTSAQKPQSAGKLTLTDLWKKAKKKEVTDTPTGHVEVVVLDDQVVADEVPAEAGEGGATINTVLQQPVETEMEKGAEKGKEKGKETGPVSVSELPASAEPSVRQAKKVPKAKRGRPKKGRADADGAHAEGLREHRRDRTLASRRPADEPESGKCRWRWRWRWR